MVLERFFVGFGNRRNLGDADVMNDGDVLETCHSLLDPSKIDRLLTNVIAVVAVVDLDLAIIA